MKIDFEFMKNVFEEALEIKGYNLMMGSKFEEVPEWDSLGHMRIIMELKQRLKVSFEIDEITDVDTVEKLIDLAKNKIRLSLAL